MIIDFEDKVQSNFDKGKYDQYKNQIGELKDYDQAVAHAKAVEAKKDMIGKRLAGGKHYTQNDYEKELVEAQENVRSTKGKALDAVKEFEIKNKKDTEAAAIVSLLGSSSWSDMDSTKKALKQSTRRRENEISLENERLDKAEYANENSPAKIDYESYKNKSNQ